MSIMTRLIRLCKADIHGVMDQLEDKGLLLKQCLREMEEELVRKEQSLNHAMSLKKKAIQDIENYTAEIDRIEQDLATAIQKEKDDISRFLIKKLKPLIAHREALQRHIISLDQQIVELRQCLDAQRLQKDQIELKAAEYFRKLEREKWDNALSNIPVGLSAHEVSDEDIEVELMRRKEAINKGGGIV